MRNNLAPIILFVFRRPEHTRKTLEALADNTLAKDSILYIYSDGAKEDASSEVVKTVEETRAVLKEKQWCKEVHIIESEDNKGLANSIIQGVTDTVNKYGKVIVLEDDIVTSPYFLEYMNDSLSLYENEEKVMHIAGYLPVTSDREKLPETFFLRHMNCWGWATWKRAWDKFTPNTQYLHDELLKRNDFSEFDLGGHIKSFEQIEQNLSGQLNTWAIKWHASIFLHEGLCMYPRTSFVDNIGVEDGTGEHSHSHDDRWRVYELSGPINLSKLELTENKKAKEYLTNFSKYGRDSSFSTRIRHKMNIIRYLRFDEMWNITIQKVTKYLNKQ